MGQIRKNKVIYSGGEINALGMFVDYDNLITTINTDNTGSASYTATEDCYAVIRLFYKDTTTAILIKVDDTLEGGSGRANSVSVGTTFMSTSLYLKKGQVLTISGCYVSNDNYIKVYGIQTGTEELPEYHIYSTDERIVGEFNGKTVYGKLFLFENLVTINADSWGDVPISNSDKTSIVDVKAYDMNGSIFTQLGANRNNQSGYIQILNSRNNAIAIDKVYLEYTKS